MTQRTNAATRSQRSRSYQGEKPNWLLIAGGALISTLSVRLGYKLKQALDAKQQVNGTKDSAERKNFGGCRLHSGVYSFPQHEDSCYNCVTGSEGMGEPNLQSNGKVLHESGVSLSLVTVPPPDYSKENGVMWTSSPDRLEHPPKPFHPSNCSDSPCVSDSGSDIFSKREVIQKLRQQLKRRDDMILEMQDQIMDLQNSLNSQMAHEVHLQSQLDVANRELFDSQREIQILRKAIADHCVGHASPKENSPLVPIWPLEGTNGHANGYANGHIETLKKGRGDVDWVEMLRKEVGELKEVIEGKEYLLQSYKEQKIELSSKIKELQLRLDSQLPNIL